MNRATYNSDAAFGWHTVARLLGVALIALWVSAGDSAAQALACAERDLMACVSSSDCMIGTNENKNSNVCVAASGRCQVGFKQSILIATGHSIDYDFHEQTVRQCETRVGCAYAPAQQCYCPPDVSCICGGGAPPNCQENETAEILPPTGVYWVVDVRSVTGVAAPLDLSPVDEAIGQMLTLSPDGIAIQGLGCDTWSIEPVPPVIDFYDPLLADVMIEPMAPDVSDGDNRILTSWRYVCEGETFLNLMQIDARVIVIPWANGSKYLIAESPLSNAQIIKLQTALAGVKFFDAAKTGMLDDPTLAAIGLWAQYRNAANNPYKFIRPVIARNLFDAMDVF